VNVHIENGTGDTGTANGLGNLIVGYNVPPAGPLGDIAHNGSHNFVIGDYNSYPRTTEIQARGANAHFALTDTGAFVDGGSLVVNTAAGSSMRVASDGARFLMPTFVQGAQFSVSFASGNAFNIYDGTTESSNATSLFKPLTVQGNLSVAQGNLFVTNGTGATNTSNGLGNVIIGYNELRNDGSDDRLGSHFLIIGEYQNYRTFGGIVAGYHNDSNMDQASVLGGSFNVAEARLATILGGTANLASGDFGCVSGGGFGAALGAYSSVAGGSGNLAGGDYSSVSGGTGNEASGDAASIGGGIENRATALYSSVMGGVNNHATAVHSSVTGGTDCQAAGDSSSVSGGNRVVNNSPGGWSGGSLHSP
jgi:hypothetical protein